MLKRSFKAEKEFGLIVGGVFTLLSVWWLYRGKFSGATHLTLPLGLGLLLLAFVFPRALIYPNRAWMKLAEALSFVMTPLIMGIVFFVIITPIGLLKRGLGWDPLRRRAGARESYWEPYSERQRDSRHYEKMY